jgi:hypothetical protein
MARPRDLAGGKGGVMAYCVGWPAPGAAILGSVKEGGRRGPRWCATRGQPDVRRAATSGVGGRRARHAGGRFLGVMPASAATSLRTSDIGPQRT